MKIIDEREAQERNQQQQQRQKNETINDLAELPNLAKWLSVRL